LLLCSLLLSVGVLVILYRKLGFIESDFPHERVAFLQRCGNTDNSDSDSGSSSGYQAKCSLFERMGVSLLHEDTLNRDAFLITAAFVLFGWWALQGKCKMSVFRTLEGRFSMILYVFHVFATV